MFAFCLDAPPLVALEHADEIESPQIPAGDLPWRFVFHDGEDEETRPMEVLYARCSGLDVHQRFVVACLSVLEDGQRRKEIRTFRCVTSDLLALRRWLVAEGCTHVGLESTGVYTPPMMLPKRCKTGSIR
jgi:hypothetical protein